MEMWEVKQISKQEKMQKCYKGRQFGGAEKVEEKYKEVPLKDRKKRIIKNETNEEKSLIGINGGQGNKKQGKIEERQFSHQRELVVESIIDLHKIREIIPEKRYFHEYNETVWSNIYKQCGGLKRKPRKTKSPQLFKGFKLQYEKERADKGKKQKEKLYMTNIPWKMSQRKRKII